MCLTPQGKLRLLERPFLFLPEPILQALAASGLGLRWKMDEMWTPFQDNKWTLEMVLL